MVDRQAGIRQCRREAGPPERFARLAHRDDDGPQVLPIGNRDVNELPAMKAATCAMTIRCSAGTFSRIASTSPKNSGPMLAATCSGGGACVGYLWKSAQWTWSLSPTPETAETRRSSPFR